MMVGEFNNRKSVASESKDRKVVQNKPMEMFCIKQRSQKIIYKLLLMYVLSFKDLNYKVCY